MRSKNLIAGVICIATSLFIAGFAIMVDPPELRTSTSLDYIRVILPLLIFAALLFWLKVSQKLNNIAFILLTTSAPFYVLIINWLAIFSLTNYRESYADVIYFCALIYFVFLFSMLSHPVLSKNSADEE